jgi:hypothetical protein
LQEQCRRIAIEGDFYTLVGIDPMIGLCKILEGNLAEGIHIIEELISRRDKEGYRGNANWMRLILAEVYLEIIAGSEKPRLTILLKNLPILLKIMITASPRIRALVTQALETPHYDPNGFSTGKSEMLLGLLHKTKKKRALAIQHLTEAKRILSQFGQAPILARVETALGEFGPSVVAQ